MMRFPLRSIGLKPIGRSEVVAVLFRIFILCHQSTRVENLFTKFNYLVISIFYYFNYRGIYQRDRLPFFCV